MPIAKITGQGLCGIALSVALLWGCFLGERMQRSRAVEEQARVLREIERLQHKQRPEPVLVPVRLIPHSARPVAA